MSESIDEMWESHCSTMSLILCIHATCIHNVCGKVESLGVSALVIDKVITAVSVTDRHSLAL